MFAGGDEFARTQKGNNNAYSQDNEISWFDWNHADWQKQLIEFTTRLIAFRKAHPIFRRPKFFEGRRIAGTKDIIWLNSDGSEMTVEDWTTRESRCLCMLLSGDVLDVRNDQGDPVRDETFVVLFNAYHESVKFALPGKQDVNWEVCLDTRDESSFPGEPGSHSAGDELELIERSLCVLRQVKGTQEDARSISWKQQQGAEAVAPPVPPRPSKHQAIDPTPAGPRRRSRGAKPPKISELAQGTPERKKPPIK